jgi:hypothetical protein
MERRNGMNSICRAYAEYSTAEVKQGTWFTGDKFHGALGRLCQKAQKTGKLQYMYAIGGKYLVTALEHETEAGDDHGTGEHCLIARPMTDRVIVSEYFAEFPLVGERPLEVQ